MKKRPLLRSFVPKICSEKNLLVAVQHEKCPTWKKVQHKNVQHKKKCNTKKQQHENSVTSNECNMKKKHHGKRVT